MKHYYSLFFRLLTVLLVSQCLTTRSYSQDLSQSVYFETFQHSLGDKQDLKSDYGWTSSSDYRNLEWGIVLGTPSFEQDKGAALNIKKTTTNTDAPNLNAWAFTPGITMFPGTRYTISFYHSNRSQGGSASFQFVVKYSKGTNMLSKEFEIGPSSATEYWKKETYTFTVDEVGTYNLGFGILGIKEGINLSIDEINVSSTLIKEFYNVKGADLSLLTSWRDVSNGTGTRPINFNDNSQKYYINNYEPNATFTLPSNLALSGENSRIILGDGVHPVTLTVSKDHNLLEGIIDVADNATLIINVKEIPDLGQLSPNSKVVFKENVPDEIVKGVEFGNVVFDTKKKNKFSKKVKIKGKLQLADTQLELGNNDLELDYGASVENGSASKFIIVNGTGRVRKALNKGEEAFLPIGRTNYSPVKIKLSDNATPDVFSVGVIDGVFKTYSNDVPDISVPYISKAVNKTWVISEGVKGGSDIELTLFWTAADVLPGFDPAKCYVKHYEGVSWDIETPDTANYDGTTYSIKRSGIKSFSPFGVDSNVPVTLPVDLLYFTLNTNKANVIELNWATASEKDNDYFAVERSTDGKVFTEINRVKGHGTSAIRRDYTFTDYQPLAGTAYYRLRQMDYDGKFEYSPVRTITFRDTQSLTVNVFPNPAQGKGVNVEVQGVGQTEEAHLVLSDMMGRRLLEKQLRSGASANLVTSSLKAGTYLVSVITNSGSQTQKLIVQ